MERTSNYQKHLNKNPLSHLLIGNFYRTLLGLISDLSLESILDVGCGEGFTLDKLQKKHIGKRLEGVDNMDEALRIGKNLHPDFILKKGDVYKLPYKDNSFDLIICTEVLEHLDDPKKGLFEILRCSSRYILLSVPNEPFFTMQRLLRGKNFLKFGDHPEHVQHWTASSFEKFVKKNIKGKIKSVKTPFPWTMILAEKI